MDARNTADTAHKTVFIFVNFNLVTSVDTIILTNSLSLKLSNFNENCQKNKKHADHKKERSLELQL